MLAVYKVGMRAETTIKLPRKGTSSQAAQRAFAREAELIVAGVLARENPAPGERPPDDRRNGFLQRRTYRLVRGFIRRGHGHVIEGIVERDRKVPANGPRFEENPFFWGLLALTADRFLNPAERWRLAKQMLFAHQHKVPSKYLVGFIYQSGSRASLMKS